MRSWIGRESSFASVTMMAQDSTTSSWLRHFSQSPAKRNGLVIAQAEEVRLLATSFRAPLVIAVARNQATAPAESIPECRLRRDCLCSRIDEPAAVLRPKGNQAPAKDGALRLAVMRADCQDGLRRRDVVAPWHLRERHLEEAGVGRRGALTDEPTAHAASPVTSAAALGCRLSRSISCVTGWARGNLAIGRRTFRVLQARLIFEATGRADPAGRCRRPRRDPRPGRPRSES